MTVRLAISSVVNPVAPSPLCGGWQRRPVVNECLRLAFPRVGLRAQALAQSGPLEGASKATYYARAGRATDAQVEPAFDGLRAEPRFAALRKKLKLP